MYILVEEQDNKLEVYKKHDSKQVHLAGYMNDLLKKVSAKKITLLRQDNLQLIFYLTLLMRKIIVIET